MNEEQVKALIERAISDEATIGWQKVLLALLDWPFLLFAFLAVFVVLFRQKIVGILERGDIQIGWGKDRHIRLRELSDGIDGEIDPIREELAQLKDALAKANALPQTDSAAQSDTLTPDQIQAATKRMTEGLRSHEYRWRSVKRLASIAGLSNEVALGILRSNAEVVLSVGKSGRQIARLENR